MQRSIIFGYIAITALIGGILYLWLTEWDKLDRIEIENKRINTFRHEIYEIHVRLIELSLWGENILEWDDTDAKLYHTYRMAVDSALCHFKNVYPVERIDTIRHLLENKEKQVLAIRQVLNEQETINDKIVKQVPVIIQKSTQEEPKKQKRKGFLGLFGKKKSQDRLSQQQCYRR